jgi:hypothetical protein
MPPGRINDMDKKFCISASCCIFSSKINIVYTPSRYNLFTFHSLHSLHVSATLSHLQVLTTVKRRTIDRHRRSKLAEKQNISRVCNCISGAYRFYQQTTTVPSTGDILYLRNIIITLLHFLYILYKIKF